jgi:hypothetical protein
MIGELSKSSARHYLKKTYNQEHHFPEISEAFDALNKKGLIKNTSIRQGRGRPEIYYKITEQGLACMIAEDPKPTRFWSLLIGFCYHRDDPVSLDVINAYYAFFLTKYLKYSSRKHYIFQLDAFNKMCANWLRKNSVNQKPKEPTLAQKVLEVLALFPRITLKEIASKTKGGVEQINRFLDLHTMKSSYYTDIYYISEEDYLERLPEQYSDFLEHCTVIVRQNGTSEPSYELSLFGIGLLIHVIRQCTMCRLSLFFNIPLEGYYEKISSNYADSLPLIFGKWSLLRKYLKVWSVYNFDIILVEEQARSRVMDIPLISGGLKEFYQNMHSIAFSISKQLNELFQTGLAAYNHFKNSRIEYLLNTETKPRKTEDANHIEKIISVHQKLEEMHAQSRFADPVLYQEELFEKENKKYVNDARFEKVLQTEKNQNYHSVVNTLQEAFSEEITFVYYLNLLLDSYVPLMPASYGVNTMWTESIKELIKKLPSRDISSISSVPVPLSPKDRLAKILSKDSDIKNHISVWIKDVSNYQREAEELISAVYYPMVKITDN